MTPSERHAAALKVLAEIDQNIAEANRLARNRLLNPSERKRVLAYRDFYRLAGARVEMLLER